MTEEQFLQYKPMLLKITNKYKNNPYLDNDDVYQIGALGMIKAFNTYQEDKGMQFKVYMYSCIEWNIKKELYNIKRIRGQYIFASLDNEIDEDTNMYDIVPNEGIDIESEAIEDVTIQEYINEFRLVLAPHKADIFIDRYIKELPIKDLAAKYDKKESTISSSLRQSRSELIRKSFIIRCKYNEYTEAKKSRVNGYSNPLDLVYIKECYEDICKDLNNLNRKQIEKDSALLNYYKK